MTVVLWPRCAPGLARPPWPQMHDVAVGRAAALRGPPTHRHTVEPSRQLQARHRAGNLRHRRGVGPLHPHPPARRRGVLMVVGAGEGAHEHPCGDAVLEALDDVAGHPAGHREALAGTHRPGIARVGPHPGRLAPAQRVPDLIVVEPVPRRHAPGHRQRPVARRDPNVPRLGALRGLVGGARAVGGPTIARGGGGSTSGDDDRGSERGDQQEPGDTPAGEDPHHAGPPGGGREAVRSAGSTGTGRTAPRDGLRRVISSVPPSRAAWICEHGCLVLLAMDNGVRRCRQGPASK